MPKKKSLKQFIRSYQYRQEATVIGLMILTLASLFFTVAMCFFSLSKASLLAVVTLILAGMLLHYRTHNKMRLRASITTLRHAHATRRRTSFHKSRKD